MSQITLDPIRFEERYFERIWGGRRLREHFGKPCPCDRPVGEAWLISDHPTCESLAVTGPCAGRTLQEILCAAPGALLGARPQPTRSGRFPLLLKLLDASDVLSVQVHPDDETAMRLAEQDVGKTEMWHVLESTPGSVLYCGLDDHVDRNMLAGAIASGDLESLLNRFEAKPGMSVFVAAGTLHAIGAGLLLAEIQQNSNLTYRCFDWNRLDASGAPRQLHIEKTLEATHFGHSHGGAADTLSYAVNGAEIEVLAACRYFAAERITIPGRFRRETGGASFHIVLAITGPVSLETEGVPVILQTGEAALIPGANASYTVTGPGIILAYYVPDLAGDIVAPLRRNGHSAEGIARLGGPPEHSDLTRYLS